MPQVKRFDPFDAEPVDDDIFEPFDAEPIEEEPKSKTTQVLESVSKFLGEHPTVREVGLRLLTGTSPEFESILQDKGVSRLIGPPTDESLLPSMEHNDNEGWPEYLGKGAYNLLVRPLGSAEGVIGASGAASSAGRSMQNAPVIETPVQALLKTVEANIPLRAEQDALARVEKGKRIAAFMGVDRSSATGASKALGQLKGELPKLDPVRMKYISPEDSDALFKQIKDSSQLQTWDQPTAITALFKLLDGNTILQPKELQILDTVFGGGFANKIIEMHGGVGAVGVKLAKTANTMKGMMSSVDMSAPLRQGAPLLLTKNYWKSIIPMFKYMKNQEAFDSGMKALVDRPLFSLGRDSGLFLADTGSLAKGEEAFLNSYLHDLSTAGSFGKFVTKPFRASERAYTGFLNKLRADTFDTMIKQAIQLGHDPNQYSGAIARYVNNATGRGGLGRLEKNAQELNMLLFSPRLISSRLNLLTNPKIYTDLPKGMRLAGLKSLLSIAALGTVTTAVGTLAGGKIGTNSLGSDFGKMRFGDQVLDPYGGFQQYIVGANRFLQGKTDSQAKGAFQPTRMSIAENFGANKLSPIASLAYTILTSKTDSKTKKMEDRFGNEVNITKEIRDRFTPMFIQDMEELIATDPSVAKLIGIGVPTALGMGTQTYPERKPASSRLELSGL